VELPVFTYTATQLGGMDTTGIAAVGPHLMTTSSNVWTAGCTLPAGRVRVGDTWSGTMDNPHGRTSVRSTLAAENDTPQGQIVQVITTSLPAVKAAVTGEASSRDTYDMRLNLGLGQIESIVYTADQTGAESMPGSVGGLLSMHIVRQSIMTRIADNP
jgi:hypothetical protein